MVKTLGELFTHYWDSLSAKLLPYIPAHNRTIDSINKQHSNSLNREHTLLAETETILEQAYSDLKQEQQNSDSLRELTKTLEMRLDAKDSELEKSREALILSRQQQAKARNLIIAGIVTNVQYEALKKYVLELQERVHQVQSLKIRELIENLGPEDISELSQTLGINLTEEYIQAESRQRERIQKLEGALTKVNSRLSHIAVRVAETITKQYENMERTQSFIYSPESGIVLTSKPLERTLKRNIFDLEDLETYSQDFVSGSREIFDIGTQNHELRFSRVKLPYNTKLFIGYITPRREGKRHKPFKRIKQAVDTFSKRLGKSIESEYATLEIQE